MPCLNLHVIASLSLRSLQRALDRRLYLLIYGHTYGAAGEEPVWHFPEKIYESEGTLRKVIFLLLAEIYLALFF